jgi:PAS domain S-box-containing protein
MTAKRVLHEREGGGVNRDVPTDDSAEAALRRNEAQLAGIIDSAMDAIITVDESQHILIFNSAAEKIFGCLRAEAIGQSLQKFIPHFDGQSHRGDLYGLRTTGEEFPMEASISHLDTGGAKLCTLILRDVSSRKESELALHRAHEELRQLQMQLEEENRYLQQELQLDHAFGEIIGHSDAIKYVLAKIRQVAPTDSTVLIQGETGTGKELVARAIHGASAQRDRPLIKVNCAALSPTLIESEFFGHEKGAFTGAGARKLGRFELADRGTIFLDEVGELPLDLQVKLLRVVQEGEFERVGGSRTVKVNVRLITATNRNLKMEVDHGRFRQDLWYRLNVFPITVPPLRQRREDVSLLVEHFVSRAAKRLGKNITSISWRTMQSLQQHSWPGNVRELCNVIERAVIGAQGPMLDFVEHFDLVKDDSTAPLTLQEMERNYILRILESTGWRVEGPYGTAKILGLNASTLRARMHKLGIERDRPASIKPQDFAAL